MHLGIQLFIEIPLALRLKVYLLSPSHRQFVAFRHQALEVQALAPQYDTQGNTMKLRSVLLADCQSLGIGLRELAKRLEKRIQVAKLVWLCVQGFEISVLKHFAVCNHGHLVVVVSKTMRSEVV